MSKIDKEDRNIVILIIIFLLLLSVFLIYNLLHPSPRKEKNKEVLSDYELLNNEEYFKQYQIRKDIINSFDTFIEDIRIKYDNNTLTIDGNEIIGNITLNGRIGLYDCKFVLFATDNITGSSYIIIYDRITSYWIVIDQIDGMYIYDIAEAGMAEAGLYLKLTRRYNNVITYKGKEYDLCTYKDNKLAESMEVMYFYDVSEGNFNTYDVLSKKSVGDIKKELCN